MIANRADEACTMGECIDALDEYRFDARDEGSLLNAAGWLARLARNREFLAELMVERIANRGSGGIDSGYGPQAIVLTGLRKGYFLRANIWPAPQDHCFRASGAASFVYGEPHDHNFDFLTVGYFGPGYGSDYFEYDYEAVAGWRGEPADLRFVERSALHEGRLMHYRAHRDVHSQLPPESLSVSLNVMAADPSSAWFDQYGFDLEERRVARVLNPGSTEVFLRSAVALGSNEALDVAQWIGRTHPSSRLRLASFEARAQELEAASDRDALWREAEGAGDAMLAGEAANRRRAMERA